MSSQEPNPPDLREQAEVQAILAQNPQRSTEIKEGAQSTLGNVVPVLRIDIRPTNVDPGKTGGLQNMKRVLGTILNDEGNRITIKDEQGRAVGVRNFSEIYPQLYGPREDGSIQVEYHEQATLGWLGDVMWSMNWFMKHGILGLPRQMTRALLQQAGVQFVLEIYYKNWLATILDQFNQRGLLIGYTNATTGDNNWIVATETVGRNIIVKPAGQYIYAPTPGGDQKRG